MGARWLGARAAPTGTDASYGRSAPAGPVSTRQVRVPRGSMVSVKVAASAAVRNAPYVPFSVAMSQTHGYEPKANGVSTASSLNCRFGSSTTAIVFTHDLLFGISSVTA